MRGQRCRGSRYKVFDERRCKRTEEKSEVIRKAQSSHILVYHKQALPVPLTPPRGGICKHDLTIVATDPHTRPTTSF